MRTITLIVAVVSSLALAAPGLAQQQRGWQGRGAASGASLPGASAPAARLNPPLQAGGWKSDKAGDWQPRRPGGWRLGKHGGWQSGKPGMHKRGWRWGDKYRGRWHAGWKAPGGWGGYRRPVRGWTLPGYWIGGGFRIADWSNWGLSSPPYGYDWVRYYDDAVLIDRHGRVWDSVNGVEWDRDEGYRDDRDDDAYGYDAERDGRYGADYDAPDYHTDAPPPPPGHAPPAGYASPGYGASMRCVANCHGVHGHGYYGAPSTTTTVVIHSAPVVTTTVVTEEVVTYGGGRKVVRRAPSKRLYRAPARIRTKTCHCR